MFELLILVACGWLMVKAIGLVFRLAWGVAKVCAGLLMVAAVPVLILCLLFAGGLVLLLPLGLLGIAFGIAKACG